MANIRAKIKNMKKTIKAKPTQANAYKANSKISKFIQSQASLNLQVKLHKFLNFTLEKTIFVLTILQRI